MASDEKRNKTLVLEAFNTLRRPRDIGRRTTPAQCPDCDCLDPLRSERAMGWLKNELQPPKR